MNNYTKYCKPILSNAFYYIGLDKYYYKASDNFLYYKNDEGKDVEVLDLLGGYGATLIGHNNPIIAQYIKNCIDDHIPVHTQFSIREPAGLLADKLNHILKKETQINEDFQFCFTSTGAETIEIALKHAEYARNTEIELIENELTQQFELLNEELPLSLTSELKILLNLNNNASYTEICRAVQQFNQQQLNSPPVFIALQHAFHGKMMVTANCTNNEMYRHYLKRMSIDTHFLSEQKLCDLTNSQEYQQKFFRYVLSPQVINNQIEFVPRQIRQVVAILAEPVQGEGGIYPLSAIQVENLNRLKDIFNCPLIADEVQSGSGRCGFLVASSDIGLKADYYGISKALGGGYVKIGVVAIRKSAFQFGFDLIQSSTFGEDDFSCKVALAYLKLLFDGPNPLINLVKPLSDQFAAILNDLSEKYPDIIKEVRYKGLLLGIEFNSTANSSSYIFQNIAAQHALGYIISGYLLNGAKIRVAPSGSAENVVRFEPSLYLEQCHIAFLHEKLDQLCLAIRYADAGYLLRPIITRGKIVPQTPEDFRMEYQQPAQPADYKVAFINHLISANGLRDVDPSIASFSDEELQTFINNSKFNLNTIPFNPARIRAEDGKSVDFIIYPIPVTSQMIADSISSNDLSWIRTEIDKRVDQAIKDGCYSVGLGMFTSIITNNGKSIKSNKIKITTGNALTVGMGIRAVRNTLQNRDISQLNLAVVGGAGNIGSIYAEILGSECHSILLVGSNRQDSLQRLQNVKLNIYTNYYHLITKNNSLTSGLLKRFADIIHTMPDDVLQQCNSQNQNPGKIIDAYLTQHYPNESFIEISQTINDIENYDIIISATNATESFIQVEHLKSNAIICDIAVPHNFSDADFTSRNDIILLRGGIVKTPLNDGLDPRVRAYLAENELYACMTETILMALAQYPSNLSYGNITSKQVYEVIKMADKYGFSLSGIKKDPSL